MLLVPWSVMRHTSPGRSKRSCRTVTRSVLVLSCRLRWAPTTSDTPWPSRCSPPVKLLWLAARPCDAAAKSRFASRVAAAVRDSARNDCRHRTDLRRSAHDCWRRCLRARLGPVGSRRGGLYGLLRPAPLAAGPERRWSCQAADGRLDRHQYLHHRFSLSHGSYQFWRRTSVAVRAHLVAVPEILEAGRRMR